MEIEERLRASDRSVDQGWGGEREKFVDNQIDD